MRKQVPVILMIFLIMLCVCITAGWASEEMPNSARAIALGNAGSTLTGGYGEVLTYNPALLTSTKPGATFFYTNKYAIPGFDEQSISISFRTGKIYWGSMFIKDEAILLEEIQGETCENNWVNLKIGLGLSFNARDHLSLGCSLWSNIQDVSIEKDADNLSGKDNKFFASVGLNYNVKRVGLSAVVEGMLSDFSQTKLAVRLGEPGSLVALAEIKYEFGEQRFNYYGGIESWIAPNFALRAGVDQAGMFTAGLGAGKGSLGFDYAYKIHPAGNTHYLSSSYHF